MVSVGLAILAAYLQRVFITAVADRDRVESRLAQRAAGLAPELSAMAALRADARYYIRQLGRRQPQQDIERKRLGALAGVVIASGVLLWLLFGPA